MRDVLPAIYKLDGVRYQAADEDEALFNCMPILVGDGAPGAHPRFEMAKDASFTANNSADRGRGITSYGGVSELYLDQDTFYYSGGSQDLTATGAPGYAGNTGFNEEYTASFIQHQITNAVALVIVSAGHTSTHASAKHGNVWWTGDPTAAPASISDADLPCNNGVSITRGGASLDGYFFVCDINGQIHNSNLNDITQWTATDFLTAEREPDTGVYLGKHHDHIVYIGTRSIEFFYNAGNPSGSPLARRQDVAYRIGCYFPNTIVEFGDIIYFVGTDHRGTSRVYKLENFQLIEISTPKIVERMRENGVGAGTFPDVSDLDSLKHEFWGSTGSFDHSRGYILTWDYFWTYYFDELTGIWSRWEWGAAVTYSGGLSSSSWTEIYPIMSSNSHEGGGTIALHQFINGEFGYAATRDNDAINDFASSNASDVFIKFPRWDAGTDQKKRINWVRVLTHPQASSAAIYDPITANLKFAKYDKVAATRVPPDTEYVASKNIDLNVRGARITRVGTGRQFGFILDMPTGHGNLLPILGLEIDYDIVGE